MESDHYLPMCKYCSVMLLRLLICRSCRCRSAVRYRHPQRYQAPRRTAEATRRADEPARDGPATHDGRLSTVTGRCFARSSIRQGCAAAAAQSHPWHPGIHIRGWHHLESWPDASWWQHWRWWRKTTVLATQDSDRSHTEELITHTSRPRTNDCRANARPCQRRRARCPVVDASRRHERRWSKLVLARILAQHTLSHITTKLHERHDARIALLPQ